MTRLLALAEWLSGESARRQVFEPLVADWQRELMEARHDGPWQHKRAMVSGGFAFAATLARCAMTGGGWLPTSRAVSAGVLAFIVAVDLAATGLLLVSRLAGRPVDFGSIQTQGYLLATAVLVVPLAMLPAVFMLRRDPRSTVRHATAAITLGAALTAGVAVFTSPEAIAAYFSSFEITEREYQRALANDRTGRYQYPGTARRQALGETTIEQRKERHQRYEAWRAEQESKRPPLTWQQRLTRLQPAILAILFGVMGWTLAGLGGASMPRAAMWWALMYLLTLTMSGQISVALRATRLPHWIMLPTFAALTLTLVIAARHRHPAQTP